MKQKVWSINLCLKGKAPRDRKLKNHRIDLGDIPDLDKPLEFDEIPSHIIESAKSKLAQYKDEQNALLNCRPEIIEDQGTFKCRMFKMFDPRVQSFTLSGERLGR